MIGAALAVLRLFEARRSARQAQARNLLSLNETWQSLQADWRRSLFLVSGQDDYYFWGTAADIDAMDVLLSDGRSSSFNRRPVHSSKELYRSNSPMKGSFLYSSEFHEAESLFLESAQRTLLFFGTVAELVLAGHVRVGDAYASFGFEAARRSGTLRALLNGHHDDGRWIQRTRVLSKVSGWASYNPGVNRRTRILIDLMWAQGARTGDLSPAYLLEAASTKAIYESGLQNRRRVRRHLRRSHGWFRSMWLAPRHLVHLRRAEIRSWSNPWGLAVGRTRDEVEEWLS